MFLIKFAHKNIKRHPKRAVMLSTAIIITTAFVIWLLSLADSSTNQITNQITSAFSGRYTLSHPEFHDDEDFRKMNFYKTINLRTIKSSEINQLAKRVFFPVFISGETKTAGSLLVGIEHLKEKELNTFSRSIKKGAYLKTQKGKGLLLGKKLAKKLGVVVGDQVALIGQGQRGAIANDLFTIKGIFSFGGAEIEEKLIITDIKSAQIFGEMSTNRIHSFISFKDQKVSFNHKKLKMLSWKEFLTDVYLTINFTQEMTKFLTSLFIMIVCIGLSNTILLSFFERRKEIATLKTIGASSKWIVFTMVYEIFVISFIGVLIGNYIGYFAIDFFYNNPINLKIFSGGQDLLLGDIVLNPKIRLIHNNRFHLQASGVIILFISLSLIYPITYTIKRSNNAI